MKPDDILDISLTNIRHQKLRSWLTILGIVVGVAAIVTLISVSLGMQQDITEQASSFGANVIRISPGGERAMRMQGAGMPAGANLAGGGGGPPGGFGGEEEDEQVITFREADDLRTVPGVYALDAQVQERTDVSYDNENSSLSIVGTEPESFEEIIATGLEDGRYLSTSDKYSAVIGYGVAHNVFSDEDMLNKQIEIDDVAFRVVGILEQTGSMAGSDNSVYIPRDTAQEIFDVDDEASQIIVLAREDHDVDEVAADLEAELMSLHGLESEEVPDFSVTTATSVESAVSSITDTLTLFLGGIASISLIVGGIGVLNTMFMSVLEQTRTIGVFKALGAKDRDIIALFLVEAGLLGLVGGVAGLALSAIASAILEMFSVPTAITPELAAVGLTFSVVVGIVAGIAPAKNAASVSPIEALRYE